MLESKQRCGGMNAACNDRSTLAALRSAMVDTSV